MRQGIKNNRARLDWLQQSQAYKFRHVDFFRTLIGLDGCTHTGKLFCGEFDPVSDRRPCYAAVQHVLASPRFDPWIRTWRQNDASMEIDGFGRLQSDPRSFGERH